MSTLEAPSAVALRLAPTGTASGRTVRLVTRLTAAGALLLGGWQALAVDDGALGTVAGLGLMALALPLARGRIRAHRLACLLAVVLVATTVVGPEPPAARAIGVLGLTALAAVAPWFRAEGDPATRRAVLAGAGLATAATVADLLHASGLIAHPLIATAAIAAAGLCASALGPCRWRAASSDERDRAAAIVARWGRDTLAPFALRRDKRYLFDATGQAFLAYRVVAGVAVVSGDPSGPEDAIPGLLARFDAHARRSGWLPAALGVGPERVADWRALGYHAHYTGDEAVLDVGSFSLDGRAIRKVRQSVTRLQRAGFRVAVLHAHEIADPLAAEIAVIADRWRGDRAETGFSMAFQSAAVDRSRDDVYAVAFDGAGRAAGFLHLAAVPAGRALSLSAMRRDRATPNGLNEYLVCETVRWAQAHGFERLSLNFAAFAKVLQPPGAVDRVTLLEQRVLRRLSGRFQLERLLHFNAKFAPSWTPRYVVYPSLSAVPRIGLAAMLAEAYLVLPGRPRP